jgi:hypothetical protein
VIAIRIICLLIRRNCNPFLGHRKIIISVHAVRQLLPNEKVFQALNSISDYA